MKSSISGSLIRVIAALSCLLIAGGGPYGAGSYRSAAASGSRDCNTCASGRGNYSGDGNKCPTGSGYRKPAEDRGKPPGCPTENGGSGKGESR